ncbi:helix-turn-helix domain-containing protein [Kaistia terrae]|nr:helix-turn-helix domain-containing protein [Kaistia terrae]
MLEAENAVLRDRVETLERDAEAQLRLPPGLGLTAHEARIFLMLMKRDVCTKEQLMNGAYDHHHDGDLPHIKIIDVFICKIRKKLKIHGVTISTVWGQGYYLDADAKLRAIAMIDAFNAALSRPEVAA